jgi:hypothetical protein
MKSMVGLFGRGRESGEFYYHEHHAHFQLSLVEHGLKPAFAGSRLRDANLRLNHRGRKGWRR